MASDHPERRFLINDNQIIGIWAVTLYEGTALCQLHAQEAYWHYKAKNPPPRPVQTPAYRRW